MKCQTAVVYERNLGERVLTFGHGGGVIDRALVMYDPETGSSWNQVTGIAFDGPLEGEQLRALPATTTTLDAWFESYPNSGVLANSAERTFRDRMRIFGQEDAESTFLMVRLGERLRAYPLASFPADGLLQDQIDGHPIALVFGRRPKVLAAWSRRVGEATVEFEARAVTAGIELAERDGPRRWSAISGRPRPPRSAPPLRSVPAFPLDREALENHFATVEVYGAREATAASVVAPDDLLTADAARRAGFSDGETVVGIALSGEARAYPVARLVLEGVLNDTLGGVAVAAIWSEQAQAPFVYVRTVGGHTLRLVSPGGRVDEARILRDEASGSRFDPATGRSIEGALAGEMLPLVASRTTTLVLWLEQHPDSRVVAPVTGFTDRLRLRSFDAGDEASMLLLVRVGGLARAYPLARFPEGGLLQDQLGDEPIVLLYSRQPRLLGAWSRRFGGDILELDAVASGDDVELRERGGTRRWSALSGRSRPLLSAPPLRPLVSLPLQQRNFEQAYAAVELFGGSLPAPGEAPQGAEREVDGR